MNDRLQFMKAEIRLDTLRESPGDGAKIVTVRMAKVGVREYTVWDENDELITRREALLPEELFSKDTLESAKGALVTYYHPWSLLNSWNYDIYSRGVTIGEPRTIDNMYMEMDVKIFDEDLQAYVLSGMCDGASIGYKQVYMPIPGMLNGESYDGYNHDVRINHLAFCAREDARGGEDLGVKWDTKKLIPQLGFESSFRADTKFAHKLNEYNQLLTTRKDTKEEPNMVTIRIDGKDYEVNEAVKTRMDNLEREEKDVRAKLDSKEKEVATLTTEVGETKKNLDTVTAEKDGIKAQLDTKEAEIVTLKAAADTVEKREDTIKKYELLKFTQGVLGDTGKDMNMDTTNVDLYKAVLKKSFPEETAIFDTKSEAYLEARMDMLKETLAKEGFPTVNTVVPEDQREDAKATGRAIVDGKASNHYSNKK